MPQVPTARPVPRESRPGEGRAVPGLDILGPSGPRIRRSTGTRTHRGSRARGPRWEPYRTGLHRGPQRRLALSRPLPRRVRKPGNVHVAGRWTAPHGRLHHGGRPLRSTCEPADARGIRPMPAVPRDGAPGPAAGSRRGRPRPCGHGPFPACVEGHRPLRARAQAALRPRPRVLASTGDARGLVPSEPEEHTDRAPHRGHVRRRVPNRASYPCPCRTARPRRSSYKRSTLRRSIPPVQPRWPKGIIPAVACREP